ASGMSLVRTVENRNTDLASPNGRIRFGLQGGPQLTYQVLFRNKPAIDASRIGMIIDGADLGSEAVVVSIQRYKTNNEYAWRGVHAKGIDRSNGARITIQHTPTKSEYFVEVRVFDDGVAFRYLVP